MYGNHKPDRQGETSWAISTVEAKKNRGLLDSLTTNEAANEMFKYRGCSMEHGQHEQQLETKSTAWSRTPKQAFAFSAVRPRIS